MRGRVRYGFLPEADVLLLELGDQLLAHAVGRAQVKLLGRRVHDVDRSGLGIGKVDRLGDDGRQHGLQVECGVDRLRHLAERTQLLTDCPSSSVRARNSVSSRTFSMAMIAWLAKFVTKSICLSVNGRTSCR